MSLRPIVGPQRLSRICDNALRALPLRTPSLEFDDLVQAGARAAGCTPPVDQAFARPLRAVTDSAKVASLNALGRTMLAMALTLRLRNHFAIAAFMEQHPEVADEPVVAPVFIVSPPRTGTTMLHRLLSLLPDFRAPRIWEMDCPPPLRAERALLPPSLIPATRIAALNLLCPDLRRTHDVYATAPEECIHLLANELVSPNFTYFFDLPEYREFLYEVDLEPAYRGHRRQLQLLQWRQPRRRWLLKAPFHLAGLGALLRVYPDASVIMTHRDPATVVPSVSSLILSLRRSFHTQVDLHALGAEQLETLSQSLGRALEARKVHGEHAFTDIRYERLLADPMGEVESIADRIDVTLRSESSQNMREHLASHRQHRHGTHRYTLEQFGLARESVQQCFAAYNRRFLAGGTETPNRAHDEPPAYRSTSVSRHG